MTFARASATVLMSHGFPTRVAGWVRSIRWAETVAMYLPGDSLMVVNATPTGILTKSPGSTNTTPCWVVSKRCPDTWY